MKVNSNFNAGATKKTEANPLEAAINANFMQQEKSEIAQVSEVTKTQRISVPVEEKKQEPVLQKEKKESFLVSMSQGERSLYKSLCALQNVSMNHFVICAMDYFKEELEEGKITISKHGYKRV